MGKTVLLLLTAVIVSSTYLSLGNSDLRRVSDVAHSETQANAFARNYAETARSAVVSAMSGTAGFLDSTAVVSALGMGGTGWMSYGGGKYKLVDYKPSPDGKRLTFTVAGEAYHTVDAATGEKAMAERFIRSTYRMTGDDFPLLAVGGPQTNFDIDDDATIEDDETGLPVEINLGLHDRYNVNNSLEPIDDLTDEALAELNGDGRPQVVVNTDPNDTDVHLGEELLGVADAANYSCSANDRFFNGDLTTSGNENFGYGASTPRLVEIDGDLTVKNGNEFKGTGMLLVHGNVIVEEGAKLRWKGVVLVSGTDDLLTVDLKDANKVQIDGSLLIRHDAPPAGGHMDLTVLRDMTGTWATPRGETEKSAKRPWTKHTHRYNHAQPGERGIGSARVVFRDEDKAINQNGQHESYTEFHDTLQKLGDEEVYIQFENAHNTGASTFDLVVDGEECDGSVRYGFSGNCDSGDPTRTRSFEADELDSFVFNVRSLRLLSRHIDNDPVNDINGEVAGCVEPAGRNLPLSVKNDECVSADRPWSIGDLYSREGSLRIQLRLASNDALIYDAMTYWHSKKPGHTQYVEEQAEQQLWLDGLTAGQTYGLNVEANDDFELVMNREYVSAVTGCLGIGGVKIVPEESFSYAGTPYSSSTPSNPAPENGGGDSGNGNGNGGNGNGNSGSNNGGGNGIDPAPGGSGDTNGDDADGSNTEGTVDTSGGSTGNGNGNGNGNSGNGGHSNNGHGNNADGVDSSNPGQGHGGPNGEVDESCSGDGPCEDDEAGNGNGGNGNGGNGNGGNGNGNGGNGNGNGNGGK